MPTSEADALIALLRTKCNCEEDFTARGMHASDCHYDFIRWYLTQEEIDYIVERVNKWE